MELPFLHWLRTQLPASPHIPLGIGDAAAVRSASTGPETWIEPVSARVLLAEDGLVREF